MSDARQTIRNFYSLVKPGVLYGNVITAVAGFLLASHGKPNVFLLLTLLIGTSLVIGSACVINNYFDQDIDRIMVRTKKRAIVSGKVKPLHAVVFGTTLGILGIIILIFTNNMLVVVLGLIGFIDYVLFYGILAKRMSYHGTLVGSVSGAIPIAAGYCAVSGTIDVGAILVFLVLFIWQMPEFYSIAIFRKEEYKAAGVPVISVVKGIRHTQIQIIVYVTAFVISTVLLTVAGITSISYAVLMALLGGYWLIFGLRQLRSLEPVAWARKMFRYSLLILLAFSGLISIDAYLP